MKHGRKRPTTKEHPLFTSDEQDGILTVEFVGTAQEVLGMKLDAIHQMHELIAQQKDNPSKAIVFTIKPGILSPENIDKILANHGLYPFGSLRETSSNTSSHYDLVDLIREMNTAKTLIQDIRSIDAFVIVALSGEMPLSLFGAAMGCDYRIAPEDFLLVNRIPQTGFTPLAGLPWFLTRVLGRAKAWELLMNHETISACEAVELGLVDRVVPKDRIKQEAIAEAKRVAALPWGCRVGLKHALTLTDKPLDDYLEAESNIFERSLEMMVSSAKGVSLKNIT
jgi:enoyl-CoA hydratase/carnithine racemase